MFQLSEEVLLIRVRGFVTQLFGWFEVFVAVTVKISRFRDVTIATNVSEERTAYIFKVEDKL